MIAGAYILGAGAIILSVVLHYYLFCLVDSAMESADHIKDHQNWQDNEHERLRQRVAGIDNRVNELSEILGREKARVNQSEKRIQELNSCMNTVIEDVEELKND